MSVSFLTLPNGKYVSFGRNMPQEGHRRGLPMAKYLTGSKMPVVVGVPQRPDWAQHAWSGLADIDGNDTAGDCCYAGIMHIICLIMAATGYHGPFPSRKDAFDLYSRVNVSTGNPPYDPNNPSTDIGGDLPTVMNYLMRNSALSTDPSWKAQGWLTVNAANPIEIKTAIWLFGATYKALNLPQGYTNPMPLKSGFTWGVSGDPDPQQGHCIIDYGANDAGSFVDTWGMEGTMTYAANAKYCTPSGQGEMHAILWPNWQETAKATAPNGLNYALLEEDLREWNAAS